MKPVRKMRPRYVKALEAARPDKSVVFDYFPAPPEREVSVARAISALGTGIAT
jgi:hypothetical protein